jgi:hydrogenase nickel incorporation protein HypA/HybF
MHELSISSAIVDTVIRHAAGRRVSLVTVRVGHLRQVVPDSLDFYFEIVARETPCEGATLEIVAVPARLACRDCEHEWGVDIPAFRCPSCGSADCEVMAGEELEVESIEVEEEEAACIAPR